MRRIISRLLITVMLLSCLFCVSSFADEARITSYAFNGVAGQINGDNITVTLPYSTNTKYWNHKVDVTEGCYFTAGSITEIDDRHSEGKIVVHAGDQTTREYTVYLNKREFVAPTYDISKATSIKKNSAKITVTTTLGDAEVTSARIVYYKKKSSEMYRSIERTAGTQEVELSGLAENTTYHYYLELITSDKTYTSAAKSFTTKKSTDTGTSSSSSSSSSSSTTKVATKGTNTTGPGTSAVQDTVKNQWKLVGDKWYYFGDDGYSKVGWFQVGDKWYYVTKGTNDLAMSEWKKINNIWYYFDASGAMLANQWVKSGNDWYYLGSSGSMITNQKITLNGVVYSLKPDGVCLDNQWVIEDGNWVYYKAGALGRATNENFVYNGVTYHADANGYVK